VVALGGICASAERLILFSERSTMDFAASHDVFRLIDREVWIITAAHGQRRGGMVATWVARTSLDPAAPRMVIGITPGHYTAELIEASGAFGLHLMDEGQIETVWPFALHSGRDVDKLAGLPQRPGETGTPLLTDCLAWLECRLAGRYDAGDRVLYWGGVIAGGIIRAGTPLREQRLAAVAGPERLARLRANLAADIAASAAALRRWDDAVRIALPEDRPDA
jgi:flavin reductase (DIM6/NTAB) family NADH-FMN oxidoreductase RutF